MKSQIDQNRLLDHFIQLIQTDSESSNEKQIANLLIEQLLELDFSVAKLPVPNNISNAYNIYARLEGTLDNSILLSCHMDTVKPGVGIEPLINNGIIRSKGETVLGGDDKSGIAVIFEAVRQLKETQQPHKTIEIAFTVHEEGGLFGSKHYDTSYIDSKQAIVLDTGGPIGTIVTAAPGQQKITAHIKGRSAHAGLAPEEGISAIQVAADAISKMKLLRIDHETTANIGTVHGGMATNIVMPELTIATEARSLNNAKLNQQVEHMISTFEQSAQEFGAQVEIESTRAYNAFVVPEDHPHIQAIKQSFYNCGVTPSTKQSGGGSDANNFNHAGITTVNISTGMSKVHTSDEFIAINDMLLVTEFIVDFLTQD